MKNKREPWRIAVAILAAIWIIAMWVKKDVMAIYATMPQEQVLPLIVTTVAVSLLKVAGLTVLILVVKWIMKKFMK